ncbi:hypothetical protein F5Y16DRAFT_406947 [Xylariaceae sp. FL0255]|nr:hypothetical protein F5Y16DRAFT_406947 [Xylariaceae sp. FL0255]
MALLNQHQKDEIEVHLEDWLAEIAGEVAEGRESPFSAKLEFDTVILGTFAVGFRQASVFGYKFLIESTKNGLLALGQFHWFSSLWPVFLAGFYLSRQDFLKGFSWQS